MNVLRLVIICSLLLEVSHSFAELKKKIIKEKQKREFVAPTDKEERPSLSQIKEESPIVEREAPPIPVSYDFKFYRYKTNFLVGVNLVKGESGLTMGGQVGYAPMISVPFYVGPEVTFSLFSPGSMLTLLGGSWYELRVYGSPRLCVLGGILVGMGFPSAMPKLESSVFEFFLDSALVQEISDLASVRGQFRPGIVNDNFAFMMNFNVSFRFY